MKSAALMLVAALVVVAAVGCKVKIERVEWRGTNETALACADADEGAPLTCIGKGTVYACVSTRAGSVIIMDCAPKVFVNGAER